MSKRLCNGTCVFLCHRMYNNSGCWDWGASPTVTSNMYVSLYLWTMCYANLCLYSTSIVVQEQDTLGDLPAAFFIQNVLQLHQQRWVILRVDSLAFWKILNEEDTVLIPKNRGENFSSRFLHSVFFGAGWATLPPFHRLLLCLRAFL